MSEYDFQKINYELKEMRKIIADAKNPDEKQKLLEDYSVLREIYKDRFDNFDSSRLFKEYDKMLGRINSLEKRYEDINSIKPGLFYFCKKRQAKRLSHKVKDELDRRYRALNDLINEIENDRGIIIESVFMNQN